MSDDFRIDMDLYPGMREGLNLAILNKILNITDEKTVILADEFNKFLNKLRTNKKANKRFQSLALRIQSEETSKRGSRNLTDEEARTAALLSLYLYDNFPEMKKNRTLLNSNVSKMMLLMLKLFSAGGLI